jgi:transposase
MADNFRACDRDQALLLPPDLRDWLPAGHLAWFALDVVDQLDLGPFLKAYRADGHGRAAYAPQMLPAVLRSAYCTGIRPSRQIERRRRGQPHPRPPPGPGGRAALPGCRGGSGRGP